MTPIEYKRQELEKEMSNLIEMNKKHLERGEINWEVQNRIRLFNTKLDGFNLGVSLAQKEFLDIIERLSKKGLRYGHDECISIEELKKSISEVKG
jgi:hypothetical protein